jgi:hypothetical protein
MATNASWCSKTLLAKRYVYHNNSNVVYNIFLTPQQEKITQRKENDVYIRVTGNHVQAITKLFLLQPDECIVLCGGVSVEEMCARKGTHVCVTGASGDWFRDEKKKNPAHGEYITFR